MGRLLAIIAAVMLALLLASSVVAALGQRSAVDYRRERLELERLEREADIAAALAPVDLAVAATWRVLPLAVAMGMFCYLAALGVAALSRFRSERRPDARGLLALPAGDSESARAALVAFHGARQLEAQRQPVPHSLTYSPHDAYHNRVDSTAVPADVAAQPAAPAPSFGDLLSRGEIGAGRPIWLGSDVATGEPVRGGIKDLYSAGLGGQQASGKSWTGVSIASQAMLNGAKVLMIDPHAGDAESLATRMEPLAPHFLAEVATNERSAIEVIRYAGDILRGRQPDKETGEIRDTSRTPVILLIDEWTALLLREELRKVLPPVIAHINVEGRKFGVVAELLAHRWSAADAGGGIVRNTLTACYVHRMRKEEARLLSGLGTMTPDDTLSLTPGQAYLVTTRGEMRKVATPHMADADIVRVAGLLTADAPRVEVGAKSARSQVEVTREVGFSASVSAEAARAAKLFAQGLNVPQIAIEMGFTKSTSGGAAQQGNARVQDLLREAWGRK